jgi:hypothetical protein
VRQFKAWEVQRVFWPDVRLYVDTHAPRTAIAMSPLLGLLVVYYNRLIVFYSMTGSSTAAGEI